MNTTVVNPIALRMAKTPEFWPSAVLTATRLNYVPYFFAFLVSEKYFTDKHEWVDIPEGQDIGTVGITDYAQV